MIRSAIKESYGTPLMRKLVSEANNLGVVVSFYNDMEGKYVIIFNSQEYVMPRGPGAGMACWFLRGIVEMAKTQMNRR